MVAELNQLSTFDFPAFVAALGASPGCLGVEVAGTLSGKQSIFAWFETKQAVMDWYYNEAHLEAMAVFYEAHKPAAKALADVPDNAGPILGIATIKRGHAGTVDGIAIEIYQPLTPGMIIGSSFAPAAVGDLMRARLAGTSA